MSREVDLDADERIAVEPHEGGGARVVYLYLDPWGRWQQDARGMVLTREQAHALADMLREVAP